MKPVNESVALSLTDFTDLFSCEKGKSGRLEDKFSRVFGNKAALYEHKAALYEHNSMPGCIISMPGCRISMPGCHNSMLYSHKVPTYSHQTATSHFQVTFLTTQNRVALKRKSGVFFFLCSFLRTFAADIQGVPVKWRAEMIPSNLIRVMPT